MSLKEIIKGKTISVDEEVNEIFKQKRELNESQLKLSNSQNMFTLFKNLLITAIG